MTGNSNQISGIVLGKATAGQAVSVDAYQGSGSAKNVYAWYMYVEV
jgi:hypothetical protein